MPAVTNFENNQRIPGINKKPCFFEAISPEKCKQHQQSHHVKKDHQAFKPKNSVADQDVGNTEEQLSARRIDGGRFFAIDMRIYLVIP